MSPAPRDGFDPDESAPWETADESEWPDIIPIDQRVGGLPEFPYDALPMPISRWIVEQARALEVPVGLAGLTALGVLATATVGQVRVQITSGWIVPCNLYVAPIASSGERKSPLLQAATAGLREALDELERRYQAKAAELMKAALFRAQAKLKQAEAAKAETDEAIDALLAESMSLDALADEFDPGPKPRLWCADATAEALEDRLGEFRGKFAVLSDEGGVLSSLGRYTKGDANLDVLLKGWDGGEVSVERRSRQVRVKHAYLSMLLMLQPWQLAILAEHEFAARGMAARFLYDWSPSRVGTRHLTGGLVPFDVATRWNDLVRDLAVEMYEAPAPVVLELSPQAQSVLRSFVEDPTRGIERRMLPEADLFELQAWVNKLPGEVARIAGLLHLAGDWRDTSPVIDAATMIAACEVGTALIPHAAAALRTICEDPVVGVARRIGAWIRAAGWPVEFNLRDVYRDLNVPAEIAHGAADLLSRRGWIRASGGTTPKGGRPSTDFLTHPEIATAHVTDN